MSDKIVDGLNKILADTFVLYFKTHSFHWNVEGPRFRSLHEMFEEQYTVLWEATDDIAERLRALGAYGPNNWGEIDKNKTLSDVGQTPDAETMVQMLVDDNTAIVAAMKPVLEAAQEAGDEVTVDLIIGRMAEHEKTAWMLRSTAK